MISEKSSYFVVDLNLGGSVPFLKFDIYLHIVRYFTQYLYEPYKEINLCLMMQNPFCPIFFRSIVSIFESAPILSTSEVPLLRLLYQHWYGAC